MESGSLLQEALEAMARKRQQNLDQNSDSDEDNEFLDVQIYPLKPASKSAKYSLDEVSAVCTEINNQIKRWTADSSYVWHAGGDGLVFGVSLVTPPSQSSGGKTDSSKRGSSAQNQYNSDKDPPHAKFNDAHKSDKEKLKDVPLVCMRAIMRYAVSVDDMWYTIALLLRLSKRPEYRNYAISVLDGTDRQQILLIEAADYLPKWAADAGPDGCSNRVWIVRGAVRLIAPRFAHPLLKHYAKTKNSTREFDDHRQCKSLKQNEAFDFLGKAMDDDLAWNTESNFRGRATTSTEEYAQILVETHSAVQDAIKRRIGRLDESLLDGHFTNMCCSERYHRAACVLPASLAAGISKRPDLVPCAIKSFCRRAQALEISDERIADQDSIKCLGNIVPFDNLVIVVIRFTKIGYAMLMSCVEAFQLPLAYKSCEDLDRMTAICEKAPYLKCAMKLGVRLTCGFEWLVASERKHGSRYVNGKHDNNGMQHRLHEWIRIRNVFYSGDSAMTLLERDERQKVSDDVKACAACPTFNEVRANICSLSHPFQSLEKQINSANEDGSVDALSVPIPPVELVDDDDWMNVTEQQFESLMAEAIGQSKFNPDDFINSAMRPDAAEVEQVESMLKSFEHFLGGSSGFEGVHSGVDQGKSAKPTPTMSGTSSRTTKNEDNNGLDDINIDPDKFLNILNGTFHDLRGDEGFFSDEEDEESDDDLSTVGNGNEFVEPVGYDDIGVSEIMVRILNKLFGFANFVAALTYSFTFIFFL